MDVLLVERSPVLRMRIARLLADVPDVRVVAISQVACEARDAAQVLQPDAVVLDMDLPPGEGMELLRHVKAQERSPYVVVLTNEPTPEYCGRCQSVADLCLDKTHGLDALVEALGHQAAVATSDARHDRALREDSAGCGAGGGREG